MKAIFSQGPNATLLDEDVKFLRENGYKDFDFENINGRLRISVVDNKSPHGKMCELGINARRHPENISPYNYEGKQLWVIRLSREKMERFINSEDSDGKGIDTRCKYDRIHIGYWKGV